MIRIRGVDTGTPSLAEDAQPLDALVPRLETRFRWSLEFRSVDSLTIEADPEIADEVQRDLLLLSREFGARIGFVDTDIEQLLSALENGVSEFEQHTGRFPVVSGLQMTFDPRRAVGDRVVSVTIDGKPLSLDRTYSLAVNEFMAAGGDGYGMLVKAPRLIGLQTSELLVNHVVAYISISGGIAGRPESRVVSVPPN